MLKFLKLDLNLRSWFNSQKDLRKSEIRNWHTEIFISGPNINGRKLAIQNYAKNKQKSLRVGDSDLTIGSSPDCWVVLPDPSLPEIKAAILYHGHHTYLFVLKAGCIWNLDKLKNFDLIRFGGRQQLIGGYLIEFGNSL